MKMTFFILIAFFIAYSNGFDIRLAEENEINWVNKKYNEVHFQHARLGDIIAIAHINSIPLGIGRLVIIDDQHYELAGIYVFEEYRNKKAATQIVEFLLKLIKTNRTIFCIAFKHLSHFYQKFGFKQVTNYDTIPIRIATKYKRCQRFYQDTVELLIKSPNDY